MAKKYKSEWSHPKHKNKTFRGMYRKIDNDREFLLLALQGPARVISFESPQMAKARGWLKK